ncbi:MAG: GTPase HflX [Proteocatella sp.]
MENTVDKIDYRAILVTLNISDQKSKEHIEDIEASMAEFSELAKAAEIEVLGSMIQNKPTVDVTYFIGKGKVEEIKELAENMNANIIIFNHELSGSQIRNLENAIGVDVIDRTMLILEIFAKRALTKDGRLQVELAQLRYRLPRLGGLGEKFSRSGGGIGSKGPGEKKLEIDKRHINARILEIEKEINELIKNRDIQRIQRTKSNLPIIALVGYTNAGKSTLTNEIIKRNELHDPEKEVFVKDMLFATLDISLRKAKFANGNAFLVTDTVGFVSRLPHTLVRAFKSTLEEVKYADLILHVIDASDKNYDLQKETTNEVLEDLGCSDKPRIIVNNKMDLVEGEFTASKDQENSIDICANIPDDIERLLNLVEKILVPDLEDKILIIPYSDGSILNEIHERYSNIETEYVEDGIKISLRLTQEDIRKYNKYILS